MTMNQLLNMWISHIGRAYRKRQVNRAIVSTERDIALTSREIADKLEAKRHLAVQLMNLKAERHSI